MKINSCFPNILSVAIVVMAILLQSCGDRCIRNDHDEIIWYNSPAKTWVDALPVGNGRIGAMVFGRTGSERIQLNDDSLWPADDGWDEPAGDVNDLQKVRQLLFDGNITRADELFVEKFSRKGITKSHQTLGDLFIDLDHKNISEYRRELNLSKAIASVTYKTDGNPVTQTVFASHPHNVIVIRLISESPDGLNGRLRLDRPEDKGVPTVTVATENNNQLVMKGEVTQRGGIFESKPRPVLEGVKFETRLKAVISGGEIVAGDDHLQLKGVRDATLFIVSNSSFYHGDFSVQNIRDLAALENVSYDRLLKAHVEDHRQFYGRVNIDLGGRERDTIPTDARIQHIKDGAQDPALEAILFQYGRYLLIGSSRPGTNPANLQGLWNEHIEAPWNADYHLNINLQMNYWPADVTNLSELNQPFFDYVDKLVENGKTTARKNFGCRGSFIPHASDLWASTWLQAATAYWGSSFGAGGWLMQHYWHHFKFTLDTVFLKERAFPAMYQVAMFYSDWLIEDPRDGSLIAAPSTSPENRYIVANGNPVALCLGSAVDQQIIAEVFDNYIKTCQILNINNDLLENIKMQRTRLREGFVIGSDGRILEWDREYPEHEPGHRHKSHLYGFHPGTSVTKTSNPELFDAVRKTLDYRLAHGGAGTGWSRAWLINYAARLLDGEMAHKHIQYFFRESLYNNLFGSHPPFQIDCNFGFTAGIAEMLLQSHEEGIIRILPALPAAWDKGHIKGLKARGGLTLDIVWENGKAKTVNVKALKPSKFQMIVNNEIINIELAKNEIYRYRL